MDYNCAVAHDGYFWQDYDETEADLFDVFGAAKFGLINRAYDSDVEFNPNYDKTHWQRFAHHIRSLNQSITDTSSVYKVFFIGRHGEGIHNVAEAYYGTKAWDDYWSLLPGNDSLSWEDAHSTHLGKKQARRAHSIWAKQLEDGLPYPEAFYVSPLYRCLQTAQITFEGLQHPERAQKPFSPVVKELLRETLHVHTCDRRSSLSTITSNFPNYIIKPGFSFEDPLWRPDNRETDDERDERLRMLLDDIVAATTPKFNEHSENVNEATFISLSTHSGAIMSLLRVMGHRQFKLLTGSMIPVVVKVQMKGKGVDIKS